MTLHFQYIIFNVCFRLLIFIKQDRLNIYSTQTILQEMLKVPLDQQITTELNNNKSTLTTKVIGTSNGLILNHLFQYTTLVFIQVVNVGGKIRYDLVIVPIQGLDQNQEKPADNKFKAPLNIKENKAQGNEQWKAARIIPLIYSGVLGKIFDESVGDIQQIQIRMKQSPKEEHIIAVQISIKTKQLTEKDNLSLLVLSPQFLKQKLESVQLLRLKTTDHQVLDFIWHPLCNLTLLTLLPNQCIEIWNIEDQDFLKPSSLCKIKRVKQYPRGRNGVFWTKFWIIDQHKYGRTEQKSINCNYYALYLMNSIGEVACLFPFLPVGSTISRQHYDQVYQSKNKDPLHSHMKHYLTSTNLESPSQQNPSYTITETANMQQKLTFISYLKSNPQKSAHVSKINPKQINYSQFRLYPIFVEGKQYTIVLQGLRRVLNKKNCIVISMIVGQLKIDQGEESDTQNLVYGLAEIRLAGENKDAHLRVFGQLNLQQKYIYFVENNGFNKLDLSSIFKFLQKNQPKHLQTDNAFPITPIFELPNNQCLCSLALQEPTNTLYFLRRSQKSIKFEIQPLSHVSSFSQIQKIAKASTELLSKLNNLKVLSNPIKLSKDEEKKTQFQMEKQKMKQYQDLGIDKFKADYQRYCDGLKNGIDEAMGRLKVNYEAMRKRLKKFNELKSKKGVVKTLLQQIQKNSTELNSLLFPKSSQNIIENPQQANISKNIESLRNLLLLANQKKLALSAESKEWMQKQTVQMLDKLKNVEQKLLSAKNKKKEYKKIVANIQSQTNS